MSVQLHSSVSAAVSSRSHAESTLQPLSTAMADPSFGSAPPAAAPMTLEGPPTAFLSDPSSGPAAGHFLPGNPLPYLAPSATHQPELLLLSWMIATLHSVVTDPPASPNCHRSPSLPSLLRRPTSIPSLSPTPHYPSPPGHDQHRPMPRHPHPPISAWLPWLSRPLSHGPCSTFPPIRHHQLQPLFSTLTTYEQTSFSSASAPPHHSLDTSRPLAFTRQDAHKQHHISTSPHQHPQR